MRSQSLKYYSFNRKTFKAVSFAFVSDQLVTDSQQLHFNDSIFNYQYPPLSVQPFSASFTFFSVRPCEACNPVHYRHLLRRSKCF